MTLDRLVAAGATLMVAVTPALTMPALTSAAQASVFFHSPTGNIECELDAGGAGLPTRAYCQTFSPARSVTMRRSGALKLCSGGGCLGNGPDNATTLGYGRSVHYGPFRCSSRVGGITCTVASGRGFTISKSGIQRL